MSLSRYILRALSESWFSRALIIAQFYFVWWILDWSMAFASTALAAAATAKTRDIEQGILMAAAANIAAVAAIPQALLMYATNKYMDFKAQQPVVVANRRINDGGSDEGAAKGRGRSIEVDPAASR